MSSEAGALISTLVQEFKRGYGLGSMSWSPYDTAWISCVSKSSATGRRQWLYPSSFMLILQMQHADGGWHWPPEGPHESMEGTILSSLAALFSITQHIKEPYQLHHLQEKATTQRVRGTIFAKQRLQCLDVTTHCGVGFDLLMPALVELLEIEGIYFQFPCKQKLFEKRRAKLSRMPVEQLKQKPQTILHSVEAFYGDKDFPFESIQGSLVHGSVMASPSATAAYLMRCKEWDEPAESYIRVVLSNGAGQSSGAAPSAFPSSNFELIWVASTLLKSGCVNLNSLGEDEGRLVDIFDKQISEDGLVGFAPDIQPDLDDSANLSIVLSLLGRPGLSRQMRRRFETQGHFETYKNESSDSLSANCSVLLALLLDLRNDYEAIPAIEKVSQYLSRKWFDADGPIKDKWNVSEYYSTMLLAQAFMKLMQCWEAYELPSFNEQLLQERIVLVAFRSCLRLARTQHSDGSWGSQGPCEETAYAILALLEFGRLPLASLVGGQVRSAIVRGRQYLESRKGSCLPEYIWVEKLLYSAKNISQAYIFAALNAPASPPLDGNRLRSLCTIEDENMTKFGEIIRAVPLLASQPLSLIHGSLVEGQLFLPMLHDVRQAVFERTTMTKDKYFRWIPTLWAVANNINGCTLSASLLFDMMRVSVLNFQVDEFMETALGSTSGGDIAEVQIFIEELINSMDRTSVESRPIEQSSSKSYENFVSVYDSFAGGRADTQGKPSVNGHLDSADSAYQVPFATRNLEHFTDYITALAESAHVRSSCYRRIRSELKAFLIAHLRQSQLNQDFMAQQRAAAPSTNPLVYQSRDLSFRNWLHCTAAVHTSCPYSFHLYLALAEAVHGAPLLKTPRQRYVADDLCGHLARMCRLDNDHGSMKRDLAEGNLNCVNFPEFQGVDQDEVSSARFHQDTETAQSAGQADDGREREPRVRLMMLADWERQGLKRATQELANLPETDAKLMSLLKVFVDVTDLFGQVYIVKDLASRKI